MKTLTKSDVFDVATDLIEDNGSATTLDVKKELRNRGFFAKQADVSEHMLDIADSEKWDFTFNGVHRVYTNSQNIATGACASTASTQPVLKSVNTTANVSLQANPFYMKRNGKMIETIDASEATCGDFKVFSVSSLEELFFSGTRYYSRSDIRFAYSVLTGTRFVDSRIKTLK